MKEDIKGNRKGERMKKRITAGILIFVMLFSTVGNTATTVEAAGLLSKVSTITTTVIGRKISSMLYDYSQTDRTGATAAGLIFKYRSGPTTTKLLAIMETTEEISAQLTEVDEQLSNIEEIMEDNFDQLKALITADNMGEAQTEITDITSDYSVSYQLYQNMVALISENGGDFDGDGEVGDDDLEEINGYYLDIYNNLPGSTDDNHGDTFRMDMYDLADVVSDDGGSASVSADVTGEHNSNDQTYIKAVKTYMETNYPFTYQADIGLSYAATFTFQKQMEMLILYTEMTAWLEGELEDNTELTYAQRTEYQARYDDYSENYEYVYNITINSMNNAAEQIDLEGTLGYADLNVTLEGNEEVEVYQTQVYEYFSGTDYYAGDIYLFPKESLSVGTGYYDYWLYDEASHTTTDVKWDYIDEYRYTFSYDRYKYYAYLGTDNETYGDYYTNVSGISDGSSLFDLMGTLDITSFLTSNGIQSEPYDYVLFQYQEEQDEIDDGNRDRTDEGYEITGRIVADQATAIAASSFTGTTYDHDLAIMTAEELENNTYINIYKQTGTVTHAVAYDISDLVTISDATTGEQEPGSTVSFTVNYDAPQVDIDEIIVTRDNGITVEVYSSDYEDDGSMECEFTMPYQGVTISVTATENRHDINLAETSNGTVSADGTACYGDMVSIDTDADFSYTLSSLNVIDIDGNEVTLNEDDTFEMPDCDVSIEAVFAQIPDVDGLDGSGTEDDPYQISDGFDWVTFVSTVNSGNPLTGVYLIFTDDIDLTNESYYTLGDGDIYFDGYLSGEGYEMTGFDTFKTFNDDENYYFIGYLGENAIVSDIVFTDTQWSSDKNSAIVGVNNGTLSDITVDIAMSSDATTFVYENNGTITNSINNSTLTGMDNYGFAVNNTGTIENSIFAGYLENGSAFVETNEETGIISNVENNGENVVAAAGISSYNYGLIEYATNNSDIVDIEEGASGITLINEGTIDHCTNYGDLTDVISGGTMTISGGIAGTNNGIISNSKNYGDIGTSDSSMIGGIVGIMSSGATLLNSFNQGDVAGSLLVGGLIGSLRIEPDPVEISYCYTSGAVEVSEDESMYTGLAIGGIFGEYGFQLITDAELVAEQITKNFVIIGTDIPSELIISNFDNTTTQNEQIVSCVHKATVTAYIENVNLDLFNYSHSSVNMAYWTVVEGVNDSLPFHATSEYEAIFPEEVSADVVGDAVDTGDNAPVALLSIAMLLSASAVIILAKKRKANMQ